MRPHTNRAQVKMDRARHVFIWLGITMTALMFTVYLKVLHPTFSNIIDSE